MTASIGKTELIDRVAASSQQTKAATSAVVAALLEAIGDALHKGENVSIPGFGSFKVTERAARSGRNPATGAAIQIAASKGVHFSSGTALKEKVNTAKKK